jgi:hypothetical protein
MGSRSQRYFIARTLIALMLFAQGVTAWSACDWLEVSPYRAVLAAAEVAPCHESGFGGACLTHCLSERQAVQKVTSDVPPMPAAPALVIAVQPEPDARLAVARAFDYLLPGSSPPRRILLQSFQV